MQLRMRTIIRGWFQNLDKDEIVKDVGNHFNCFGGGKSSDWNPVAAALSERNLCFAAGVDVEEIVDLIIRKITNG